MRYSEILIEVDKYQQKLWCWIWGKRKAAIRCYSAKSCDSDFTIGIAKH